MEVKCLVARIPPYLLEVVYLLDGVFLLEVVLPSHEWALCEQVLLESVGRK